MEFQQKANREVPRQLTKYNLNFIWFPDVEESVVLKVHKNRYLDLGNI